MEKKAMARLEWLRASDRETSETEIADISLRVERDSLSSPPYSWEVRGVAETRRDAFEASEKAALAALRMPLPQIDQLDALIGAVHRQQAYVVIEGKPNNDVLLPLLSAARTSILAPHLATPLPVEKQKKFKKKSARDGKYTKPGPKARKAAGARI